MFSSLKKVPVKGQVRGCHPKTPHLNKYLVATGRSCDAKYHLISSLQGVAS